MKIIVSFDLNEVLNVIINLQKVKLCFLLFSWLAAEEFLIM